jgi:RNA polymerase sigma-70 factor (ECF subfamily)
MGPISTLEVLVAESAKGNTLVFKELYDRLADRIFSYVRSRSRSREDALDITQEVFLDFWKSLTAFKYVSDGKLYGFLYTIAIRRISKHYRFSRPQISIEDVEDVLADDSDVSLVAEASRAMDSMRRLGGMDQRVIELRYYSGLQFAEIAEILGKNESAVKVRHHRAIEKLQLIFNNGK